MPDGLTELARDDDVWVAQPTSGGSTSAPISSDAPPDVAARVECAKRQLCQRRPRLLFVLAFSYSESIVDL